MPGAGRRKTRISQRSRPQRPRHRRGRGPSTRGVATSASGCGTADRDSARTCGGNSHENDNGTSRVLRSLALCASLLSLGSSPAAASTMDLKLVWRRCFGHRQRRLQLEREARRKRFSTPPSSRPYRAGFEGASPFPDRFLKSGLEKSSSTGGSSATKRAPQPLRAVRDTPRPP